MPTPSDDALLLSPPAEHEGHAAGRTTCPPEESRQPPARSEPGRDPLLPESSSDNSFSPPAQQPTPPAERDTSLDANSSAESHNKRQEPEEDGPIRDIPSPLSAVEETADCDLRNAQSSSISTATSSASATWYHPGLLPSPFSNARVSLSST
jgi:hypothetical protein